MIFASCVVASFYSTIEQYDFANNDLLYVPSTTLPECYAQCDSNLSCIGVVVSNNPYPELIECWLKGKFENGEGKSDRIVYFKDNGQENHIAPAGYSYLDEMANGII